MNNPHIVRIVTIVVAAVIVILISSRSIFLTIDPGEKGVLFKRFGGGLDKETVYSQGFHMIAPWNKMYVYDVRIHEALSNMEVLSKNGLTIKVELSYRYHPIAEKIGHVHDEVGPTYHDRIILPEIRSATREVIGKYLPEELYSTQREAIQLEIYQRTFTGISRKHLNLDAVLIREVVLPPTLQTAIEQKLKREQESLEYEFRLQPEQKEAERKRIEAEGISDFQKIVTQTITPSLLKWKGIEATETLAKSPNAKVIVIGSAKDGLPIILGGN